MVRFALMVCCVLFLGCKSKKQDSAAGPAFSYDQFAGTFKELKVPFQITDVQFLKNRDTAIIRNPGFSSLIPDSLEAKWFGKGSRVRYVPIGKITKDKNVAYYIVKAMSGTKRSVVLMAFNHGKYSNVLPLLVPDNDPATTQATVIDKARSIQKNTTLHKPDNSTVEGKDVYEFYADQNAFSLILTVPVNNAAASVFNPIDTLPRKHKFSGDYRRDKNNFVSVRDGRSSSQLRVFIHFRTAAGCSGELKGDLLITSPTSAIYRESGDPCIMTFRFSANTVTLKEEEGCGSHRDLDCVFDGSYTKKKELKPRTTTKRK